MKGGSAYQPHGEDEMTQGEHRQLVETLAWKLLAGSTITERRCKKSFYTGLSAVLNYCLRKTRKLHWSEERLVQ